MKNSYDTFGNRTCDLPGGSAVPQPTAPPRAPIPRRTEIGSKMYIGLHVKYVLSLPDFHEMRVFPDRFHEMRVFPNRFS